MLVQCLDGTPICTIIGGRFQGVQQVSSSELVLKTVDSLSADLQLLCRSELKMRVFVQCLNASCVLYKGEGCISCALK
jgi:hypothetical protein